MIVTMSLGTIAQVGGPRSPCMHHAFPDPCQSSSARLTPGLKALQSCRRVCSFLCCCSCRAWAEFTLEEELAQQAAEAARVAAEAEAARAAAAAAAAAAKPPVATAPEAKPAATSAQVCRAVSWGCGLAQEAEAL